METCSVSNTGGFGITNTNIEKERAQLIKKIYGLGFEVGLKNHSEIGWVIRDYNALVEDARKFGIKSPELYYHDGRIKGKASREKGDEVNEKNADIVKKVTISEIKNETYEIEGFEFLQMQQKPGLNELMTLVKQTGHTEVPQLLGGFKPLRSSIFRDRKKDK